MSGRCIDPTNLFTSDCQFDAMLITDLSNIHVLEAESIVYMYGVPTSSKKECTDALYQAAQPPTDERVGVDGEVNYTLYYMYT